MASTKRRLRAFSIVSVLAFVVAAAGCATATPPPPAYEDAPAVSAEPSGKGPVFYTADEPPPGANTTSPVPAGELKPVDGSDAGGEGVKLVSAGAEPRAVLKLDPKVGTKEKVTITSAETTTMEAGAANVPAQSSKSKIELTLKVTAVKDGAVEWEFKVVGVEAPSGDNQPKLGDLKGATGKVTTKANGEAGDVDITSNADTPSKDLLRDALNNVTPIFPAEEVGAGAKWTLRTNSDAGGIHTSVLTTYGLDGGAKGGKGKLSISSKHTAPPQDFNAPGLPMPGKVTSYEGSGSGSLSFDTKHLSVRTRGVSVGVKTNIELAGLGDSGSIKATSKGEEHTDGK